MAIDFSNLSFGSESKGTSLEAKVVLGLAGFGILSLAYISTKLFSSFLKIFLMPGTNLRKFGPKGSWAVITGASDGIGKEYVYQLAAKGFNIVLVSRTETKLRDIATEIISKYSVEAKYLPMDFTRNLDTDYDKLEELVRGLDIAILVNNVGLSHEMPVPFLQTERQEMDNIIMVNCIGTLRVTKLIAPGMAERKRGLILTMGSFAGLTPTPLLATYSGSKAFLSHWSTALASELAPKGVRVELINSYLVTSAMSKVRRPNMSTPTPKAFVRSALKSVGVYMGNTTGVVTPFWSHGVIHWAMESILGLGSSLLVGINRSLHEDIRRRALRKKEREAKKQ